MARHLTQLLALSPADLAPGRLLAERREAEPQTLDALATALHTRLLQPLQRGLARLAGRDGLRHRQVQRLIAAIQAQASGIAQLDDDALQAQAQALRKPLGRDGFGPTHLATVARAFAVVQETAARVLGRRHYPTQLAAGWWLLQGTLVEMATGEGKTMAATLPAATAALAGLPVHVVTANDYLAERDAQALAPLYQALGLRCSAVLPGQSPAERALAYAADIAYVSNQVLAFDYLRDRSAQGERAGALHRALDSAMALAQARPSTPHGQRPADGRRWGDQPRPGDSLGPGGSLGPGDSLLRGLVFAIVDEADSIFIDEARTPLILSARLPLTEAQRQAQAQVAQQALALARGLAAGRDYNLLHDNRQARLSDQGRDRLAQCRPPDAPPRETEQTVEQALVALHLLHRDQHYVVAGGQVRIVDESTGRAMPDRSWERGLHQLVEAKEGLAPTAPNHTLARLTCQRLYRRYLRLAGMSGTVAEVAGEITLTYGLPSRTVPNHRPLRRQRWAPRGLPDQAAKWAAVVQQVQQVALGQGRPVLVGTRTVADSMALSARLAEAGIPHQVLNALQDADEAAVVARAGEPGRVTVATDMAGRGTDIALAPGVAERGGLHVILTAYAPSRRVDRQLTGRAGRQGDPGSVAELVALDDGLFQQQAPRLARLLAPLVTQLAWPAAGRAALALLRWAAQQRAESLHRAARRMAERLDREQARLLAYSGSGE